MRDAPISWCLSPNARYWIPKLNRNCQRDAFVTKALQKAGWRVLIVWECELKKPKRDKRLNQLYAEIIVTGKIHLEECT